MASNKEEAAEATSDLKEPLTENNGKYQCHSVEKTKIHSHLKKIVKSSCTMNY